MVDKMSSDMDEEFPAYAAKKISQKDIEVMADTVPLFFPDKEKTLYGSKVAPKLINRQDVDALAAASKSVDFPPICSIEDFSYIKELYETNPFLKNKQTPQELRESNAKRVEDNNAWIQTFSGKKFYLLNPTESSIDIEDIAHSLSMLCRFVGHCSKFYSIAQHSVLASMNCNPEHALQALLHDGSEAYCSDLSSPLKNTLQLNGYRDIEYKIQSMIYKKYNCNEVQHEDVKEIDLKMFSTEVRDLLPNRCSQFHFQYDPLDIQINPVPPKSAKHLFLARFYQLTSSNWE